MMKKLMRMLLSLTMAMGMFISSACDFLPMGNHNSSSEENGGSSQGMENSSEEFSSQAKPDPSENYNLLALQTLYSLLEGDTVALKVKVLDDGVSLPIEDWVTFTSLNPDVATVDEKGNVTGVKEGKTVIMATMGDQYKSLTITVEKLVKEIRLDQTTYGVTAGNAVQVQAEAYRSDVLDENATFTYEIADTSIATVTESGLIVGIADGETSLTVTYDNVDVSVPVTVYTSATTEEVNSFSEDYVNIYGRTYITSGRLNLDHVASGVEVSIIGTSLTARLSSTSALYVRVFVDDEEHGERIALTSGVADYVLAKELSNGYHKIRIVKSSELFDGQIDVVSFSADGFAVAPQKGKIKIEFIGDSITTGYGVLGASGQGRTVENSDGCYSFSYRTAQKLRADYSTIAVQGICAKAYHWNKTWNMYSLYQNVSANFNNAKYDFSFHPDVIVLGLGTNEASYMQPTYGGSGYGAQFPTDYQEMLTYIREKNPDAYIICIYGMMGTNFTIGSGIYTAVQNMNDDRIEYMTFSANNAGANGHPTDVASEAWAKELAAKIESILEK